MADKKLVEGKYLMYKDKPFVRSNNIICFGDLNDKYILLMIIISTKKVAEASDGVEVPDRIFAQILSTDVSKKPHERIEKQFEKNGLYEAMDMGLVLLERLNSAS